MGTKRQIRKIGILIVVLALAGGGAWITGALQAVTFQASLNLRMAAVLHLVMMASGVLLFANLVLLVLAACQPKSHRGRTLISLASSLTKYAAALIILCWGLTILGWTYPPSWPVWVSWR